MSAKKSSRRLLFLFFRHARARSLLCVLLHELQKQFVDHSLQKTQLLRSERILFTDILAGFTCCWAHPSESSTVLFFKFSGLCSEHCSKLEHCVASVFSMYIFILRFNSFFSFLFIYLFLEKDVFRRLNFWEVNSSFESNKVFSLKKKTV